MLGKKRWVKIRSKQIYNLPGHCSLCILIVSLRSMFDVWRLISRILAGLTVKLASEVDVDSSGDTAVDTSVMASSNNVMLLYSSSFAAFCKKLFYLVYALKSLYDKEHEGSTENMCVVESEFEEIKWKKCRPVKKLIIIHHLWLSSFSLTPPFPLANSRLTIEVFSSDKCRRWSYLRSLH